MDMQLLNMVEKYNGYINILPISFDVLHKGKNLKELYQRLNRLGILGANYKIDTNSDRFKLLMLDSLYMRNQLQSIISELNQVYRTIKPIDTNQITDLSQELIDSANSVSSRITLLCINNEMKIQFNFEMKGDYHTISEEFSMVASRLRSFGYFVSRSKLQRSVQVGYRSYNETIGFKLSVILAS